MKPGTRVTVTARWSSMRGLSGTVVALHPSVMVVLDGDTVPLRIEPVSLEVQDAPSDLNLTGAE